MSTRRGIPCLERWGLHDPERPLHSLSIDFELDALTDRPLHSLSTDFELDTLTNITDM